MAVAPLMTGQVKGGAIEKAIERAGSRLALGVQVGTSLAGNVVKAKAQDNLSGPILKVKTGHLRASILVLLTRAGLNSSVRVGSPTIYGAAHEFGSRINTAVKWLRTSLAQSRDKIREVYTREIDKALSQ